MKTIDWRLQRTFYFLGSLVLVGSVLYWGRPILIPVTVAVLLTFALTPVAGRLERWGLPRFIACTTAVLGSTLLMVGIIHVFTMQVRSLGSEVPEYRTQISEKIGSLRDATAESWVADVADFANEVVNKPGAEPVKQEKGESLITRMDIPFMAILQSVAGTAAEILFNAILVLVLTLLMLMRREDLRNRLIHLLGVENVVSTTRMLDDASKRISRFLACQLMLNLGFGVVVAGGLYLIGIPYAYVWGAMAAVLRYIPFLGGWIAAAFPLLISLVMPSWTPFFLTAGFFVVIEMLQANLVEPQAYGRSIGVSSVSQLVAVLFWGCLWGPVGLIVSTPLTACVCVLGRHFSGMRFLAALLGEEEIVEKPAAFYQRLVAGDTLEASAIAEEVVQHRGIVEACDTLILPALLSAADDESGGDLSREDQVAIVDAVREIALEAVGPRKAEFPPQAETNQPGARVLVVNLPFHDETDGLIIEMLESASSATIHWTSASAQDIHSQTGEAPTLVLLSCARPKHFVRIHGLCKSMRHLFPDAAILVGCWTLDDNVEPLAKRLRNAGATAVCSSFLQANKVIDESCVGQGEKNSRADSLRATA